MRFKKLALLLCSALFCAFFSSVIWAAGAINTNTGGVAVKGYDPVAYFTDNKAVLGKAEFSAKVDGATYQFASAANLDAFVANPSKYQPQYGGYCAYGVAQGFKPDIDPQAFSVVDGKLFLNLSPKVLTRWQEDIPGHIRSANENWKSLINQ